MNGDQSHSITGNARIAGLQEDLHLSDKQYQICNTIVFVYVVPWKVAHWDLSNTLGHTSLRSSLPTFFSGRLVQGCFCLLQSFSGLSWPHYKVSGLGKWSRLTCIHFSLSPGFVTSYAGLVTVRAFLGLVEGPMAPGIVLYFSGFYIRKELSFRYVWLLIVVASTILTLI